MLGLVFRVRVRIRVSVRVRITVRVKLIKGPLVEFFSAFSQSCNSLKVPRVRVRVIIRVRVRVSPPKEPS